MVRDISREAGVLSHGTPEERFFGSIQYEPNSGCWLWERALWRRGYGRFKINGKYKAAHRFSYEIHHGGIPEDQLILHRCDTPPCVNPNHLFAGTEKDNMVDMVQKGRNPNRKREAHPLARLSQTDIDNIRRRRASGEGNNALAREYGISYGHCSTICNGKRWK
jgi:hypothetical protein